MNLLDYMRYVSVFNSQDWELLHGELYAHDITIDFTVARFMGAEESLVTGHETKYLPAPRLGKHGDHLEVPMSAHYVWKDGMIQKIGVQLTGPGSWERLLATKHGDA